MIRIARALLPFVIAMGLALPAHAFEGTNTFIGSRAEGSHKLALGAQYHGSIDSVSGLPLKRGDLGYLLAYEYHEEIAFWQIGLGYAPEKRTESKARLLTPQINLIFKDGIYRLGAGALKSHVEIDGTTHWTDLYWQMMAGIEIPLGSHAAMGLYGSYLFDAWDNITETEENGLTATLLLSWGF